jgi:protein-tyrosine-phosphatase
MKRILFICIENSCRSQIAEGYARKFGKDIFDVWSAGSKPSGKINPTAIEVMKEEGIDLAEQRSKSLHDLPKGSWDYLITLGCGDACPSVPAQERIDWAIPDPKNLPIEDFRTIRDLVRGQVLELLKKQR